MKETVLTFNLILFLVLTTTVLASNMEKPGEHSYPVPPEPVAEETHISPQVKTSVEDEFKKSFEECIERYIKEFNTSKDEAISKCAPPVVTLPYMGTVVTSPHIEIIEKCRDIENELKELTHNLEFASFEETEEIKEKIEELKQEYTACIERPAVAPKPVVPYDACEEKKFLEDSLKALEQKYDTVKELYKNGTITRDELLKYEIELDHTEEKLKKIEEACQRKETPKEAPCARLEGLQKMYDELKVKAEMSNPNGTAAPNEKLSSLLSNIEESEKECREKPMNATDVTSLVDIQKAYETKLKELFKESIVSNVTDEKIIKELKEIEKEKSELIKEFAKRMEKLEIKKQELIKSLKIGVNVSADKVPITVQKIEIEIEGKGIEITPGEMLNITHGGVTAYGDLELEYVNGTLIGTRSKKELKILPDEVVKKIKQREKLTALTLNDSEKEQKYFIETEKTGKLLWTFPVETKIKYEIDATTGIIKKEDRPWWDFFITTTECPIEEENIPGKCFSRSESLSYPYDVSGNFSQACDKMKQKGPDGYYGMTYCDYGYTYCTKVKTEVNKKKCECNCTVTADVKVKLNISTELPRWVDYENASETQQKKWDTFLENLRKHEEKHADICKKYKEKFKSELEALSESATAKNCKAACEDAEDKLDKKLESKHDEIKEELNKEQDKYDNDTNHGATEGATIDCNDP